MVYSKVQVFLHWFSAVIILWATASGFYVAFSSAPVYIKEGISFFNVSITAVLIPFFAVRMLLAFSRSTPKPRAAGEWVALVAHKTIYLVTTAVLVTGVLMMDRDINIFNVISISQPLSDEKAIRAFNRLHKYACMALAGLLVLHVAAVVKHHMQGNPVLKRMSW